MSIETPRVNKLKETPVDSERAKIVEEVFRKYNHKLIRWCIHKMAKRNLRSPNPETDAEDIVAQLFEELLMSGSPIDLTRSESDVSGYLNKLLNQEIARHTEKEKRKKRIPRHNLVPFEEIRGVTSNTSRGPRQLTEDARRTMQDKLAQALLKLAERNPKMADVIRRRMAGETDQKIAEAYGNTKSNIQQLRKKAERIIRGIVEGRIQSSLSIPKRKNDLR